MRALVWLWGCGLQDWSPQRVGIVHAGSNEGLQFASCFGILREHLPSLASSSRMQDLNYARMGE